MIIQYQVIIRKCGQNTRILFNHTTSNHTTSKHDTLNDIRYMIAVQIWGWLGLSINTYCQKHRVSHPKHMRIS